MFRQLLEFADKIWRRPLYHHQLTGSLLDGSSIARVFNSVFDQIDPSFEADLETNLATFPLAYAHCLKDISNKPGFVRFQVLENDCFCASCLSHNLLDSGWQSKQNEKPFLQSISNQSGYILSEKVKNHFLVENSYSETNNYLHDIKAITALLLNETFRSVTLSNCFEKSTKATNAIGCEIYTNNVMKIKYSLDLSYNIKLDWSTKISQSWIHRNRSWPSLEDLKDEISHVYIIAKPSFKETGNLDTTELRYSFAHVERKLFSLQSSTQKLIYLIFKSMFYKWVVPIEPDRISSYIAKTIMLWTCEEKSPKDIFWKDTNASIISAVTVLFQKLLTACKNTFLPYYFVPEINILGNLPHNVIGTMELMVEDILTGVAPRIPSQTNLAKTFIETCLKVLQRTKTFMKNVEEQGSIIFGLQSRFELAYVLPFKLLAVAG